MAHLLKDRLAKVAGGQREAPRQRSVRIGESEAITRGLETRMFDDFSHRSMTTSWPIFVGGAAIAFLLLNAAFALAYYLGDAPVANVPEGSYLYNLYFSIETIATVGYGDLHPQTHYGHIVASLEMFAGLFYAAVLTGLIFARFARPRARVLFAERIVITQRQNRPTLMLRMANERQNSISNASAKLWLIRSEEVDGRNTRSFIELSLVRRESPVFTLSWTVYHEIDAASPLFGLTAEDLARINANLVVVIDGFDESSAQLIRARRSYTSADLRFGERYVDILEMTDDGTLKLDYRKFHATEAPERP